MKIRAGIIRLYDGLRFNKYVPIILFIFALLLRLGLIFALKTYTSPYHVSEHVKIADNILTGKGYSFGWYKLGSAGEGSFMPPAYVALVLVAKVVFASKPWLAIQVFQALCSACTVMLLYFIGREIFNKFVGIAAALLIIAYPPNLGYVLDIQAIILETFLVTFIVFAGLKWRKYASWKSASILGLALGLVVLSRSNLVLLLPLLLVWMVMSHRRQGFIHFIIVTAIFTLILGPWVLRNYLVHQDFVFVSTNGGHAFFQGNNINATGVSYHPLSDLWKQYPHLAEELAPLGEAARDKRLYQEGLAFIRMYPQKALLLAFKKLFQFWWFKPNFINGGVTAGYPRYFGFVYIGSYVILLGFFLVGLVRSLNKYRELFIFYSLLLIQMLVSMVFIAGTRYRGIMEPLMIVLAVYGMVWGMTVFLESRYPDRNKMNWL